MAFTEYDDEEITRVLKAARGKVHLAAEKLGCSPVTIYKRMKAVPSIRQVVLDARERLVDKAEVQLEQALGSKDRQADPWAIQFTLKTLGKKRGYTEKQEVEHTGAQGGPIQLAAVDLRGLTDEQLDEWKQLAERQQALLGLARVGEPRPAIPAEPYLNGTGEAESPGVRDPEQPE